MEHCPFCDAEVTAPPEGMDAHCACGAMLMVKFDGALPNFPELPSAWLVEPQHWVMYELQTHDHYGAEHGLRTIWYVLMRQPGRMPCGAGRMPFVWKRSV